MQKNVASQKIQLFAFNATTNVPKTGDAANITAYVSKDHGAVTVLGDTSATEMDAANSPGVYVFDLTQGETNGDELTFSAKSSTADIKIVPRFVTTVPVNYTLFSLDGNGRVDTIKLASQTITAAAGVTFPSSVASPTNITAGTITTATNVTTVNGLAANVITATSINIGAITAAKFASGAIDATAFAQGAADLVWNTATRSLTSLTGFRLSATGVNDILRTALTEGYAADNVAPTLEQFLFMSWAALTEFSIAGTTLTSKKLDGVTTAGTWTLDSATTPTSRTRAT